MLSDTVLVTGGAGFVGSNFVLGLLATGRTRVITLDALTGAGKLATLAAALRRRDHAFVRGRIGDGPLVRRLLARRRPGAVINFAAETREEGSVDGPEALARTNVTEARELLEAVLSYWEGLSGPERDRFRFVHVSTDEVYGSLSGPDPFTEESPHAPSSPYAASKSASDRLVSAYHRAYGLPAVITNGTQTYGPRQLPEKQIPLFINDAIRGEPLPAYGGCVRDRLYVEDHCRAIRRVLAHGRVGESYNVGGHDGERTDLEVVTGICELLDDLAPDSPFAPHGSLVIPLEGFSGRVRRSSVLSDKIVRETGWFPQETFETGLEKTVRWYLNNGAWCARVSVDARGAGKRLGLAGRA